MPLLVHLLKEESFLNQRLLSLISLFVIGLTPLQLERLDEQEKLHGELSAAEAIQKLLQESELNDTITLQEASNSVDPTEKQRQPKDTAPNSLIQPQADTSSLDKAKRQDKQFPVTTPPQPRDANARVSSTITRSSLQFPSRLDVNTPAFAPPRPRTIGNEN